MKYYYTKPDSWTCKYGTVYRCEHPLFTKATLYFQDNKGMLVIQQRFNPDTKHIWWGELDPWLVDEIYLANGFQEVFSKFASEKIPGGIFPEIKVRKLMWMLRMKPLKREFWES